MTSWVEAEQHAILTPERDRRKYRSAQPAAKSTVSLLTHDRAYPCATTVHTDSSCPTPSSRITVPRAVPRPCYNPAVRIFDLSLPISPALPTWQGDPPVTIQQVCSASPADPHSYNLSRISLSTHAGTHLDPPRHFGGSLCVDQLPLDVLCGPVRVVDLRNAPRCIDLDTLSALNLNGVKRLLFATHRGEMHASPMRLDHAFLTQQAASFLRHQLGLLLVGTDCFSIDRSDSPSASTFPAHHALLQDLPSAAPVVIVEGLRLHEIQAGDYELFCLPLPLANGDGAPARVVLVQR